jgi:hypothetical protein
VYQYSRIKASTKEKTHKSPSKQKREWVNGKPVLLPVSFNKDNCYFLLHYFFTQILFIGLNTTTELCYIAIITALRQNIKDVFLLLHYPLTSVLFSLALSEIFSFEFNSAVIVYSNCYCNIALYVNFEFLALP